MTSRVHVQIVPRLLNKAGAAAYCGLSVTLFGRECDVQPVSFGDQRADRWDRLDLDAWIDRRKGGAAVLSADDWLARAGDDDRAR
jgi:siroheme synthase